MRGNPYDPPSPDTAMEAAPACDQSDLRRIAKLQRVVVGCIWMYVLLLGTGLLTHWGFVRKAWMSGWGGVATVMIGAIAVVPVFLLIRQLNGGWRWIVLCPMTIVPPLGLLVLLTANNVATRTLREHGVEVGWFGAGPTDPSKLGDEDA